MRVYLAAAMTNADRDLEVIRALHDEVEARGHAILTPQVAAVDGIQQDAHLTDGDLARRDLALLASSHAVIAEVSTPSHGVGIEVMVATREHIPVLLVHRRGVRVSRLLLGLPGTTCRDYAELHEARAITTAYLESLSHRE
jgi:2'-deoxynucleoside 5'-phosphate N-hydrolase